MRSEDDNEIYWSSEPIKLTKNKKISSGAKVCYIYWHSLPGEKNFRINPSLERNVSREETAKILGVSKKTISNYLYELEEWGWITVKNSRRKRITIYLHGKQRRRKKRKKRT